MDLKELKLNLNKAECLFFGRKTNLRILDISSLQVYGSTVDVKREVKDLGVLLISSY